MKIIEEVKPKFFEVKKLSPEEKTYQSAVTLMESVECVERFERAVQALENAAGLFESLGDYKDSVQKAKACQEQAKITKEVGMQEAYDEAENMYSKAVTKMDYRTVISEFQRIPDYLDSAERIQDCKKAILRLETKNVWKRRGIVVFVLAACAGVFWISPAKPYVKGLHQMRLGHYKLAIADFKEAGDFIDSAWQKKKCRYKQAEAAYEKGDLVRAFKLGNLARGRADADEFMAKIEVETMQKMKEGSIVQFGEKLWQLMDIDGKYATLLLCDNGKMRSYNTENGVAWKDSKLRKWMNVKYKKAIFSTPEKKLLNPVVTDNKDKPDKLFLLTEKQYNACKSQLELKGAMAVTGSGKEKKMVADADWWLRPEEASQTVYVNGKTGEVKKGAEASEEKAVRPVVNVILNTDLIYE